MIKFNEFINEKLKYLSSGVSSDVYSSTKKEVVKKPKDSRESEYSHNEIRVNILMSKRPDLFAVVHVNRKDITTMEKLDNYRFIDDYNKYTLYLEDLYGEELNTYNNTCFYQFYENTGEIDLLQLYEKVKEEKMEDFIKLPSFVKNFLTLKDEMYKYFKKNSDYFVSRLDLHSGNFGYKIGSKEIRCFDPILIEHL